MKNKIMLKLKKTLWHIYILVLIKIIPFRYKRIIKKTKKKNKIRVAFLIQLSSSWKYDILYNLLNDNNRFEPFIIIIPITKYDSDTQAIELKRSYEYFSSHDYKVYSSWDEKTSRWIDIKQNFQPDIIFFSNPWQDLSLPEHYLFNFLNTLTCYVPYGFKTSHLYQAIFNKPFQNLLWAIFYESNFHLSLAQKYGRNKGVNGIVSGYPGMDNLLDTNYQPGDSWKIKNKEIKKVIWAPHHSIFGKNDSNVGFSTFLRYHKDMTEIAEEYKNQIQFSFKPHPLLKPKLYKHPDWGKEKTDNYYKQWEESSNTQINEGNYIDLFLTSDAIINDGESFMVEYLYSKKPSMFLLADSNVEQRLNDFGKLTLNQLYKGNSKEDILWFLKVVVLEENDSKEKERLEFFEKSVKPPNNLPASENIYNFLCEKLS